MHKSCHLYIHFLVFMGKSLPSSARLQGFARVVASERLQQRPKLAKPISKTWVAPSLEAAKPKGELERLRAKMEESSEEAARLRQAAVRSRMPLAEVVSDCVKRWFQDTLKEAKAGDSTMQVLVGQMYFSGYGVPRDPQKGRAWITRASKNRPSVWKVSDKRPGYNASDSDSDELKSEAKS